VLSSVESGLSTIGLLAGMSNRSDGAGKKTVFLFEPFMYIMIILLRQARDKHRESTQKRDRFLGIGAKISSQIGSGGSEGGGGGGGGGSDSAEVAGLKKKNQSLLVQNRALANQLADLMSSQTTTAAAADSSAQSSDSMIREVAQ
jgi:hypothetical protein